MSNYQQIDLFSSVNPYFKLKGEWKVIELFAGIGSQIKSLKLLEKAQGDNKEFTIKHHKICEWAFNSIVMYNLIHIKDFTDYAKDMSKEELIKRVKGVSTDYNSPLTLEQLNKKPLSWLQEAYNNIVATNNLIDISNVKGRDLDFDNNEQVIMSYSFPCQDLSLAGKMLGANEDSGTRSSLLYQVVRILRERERERLPLPKILLMENVSALTNQKNIHNLQKVEQIFANMGYTNYIDILDTKDYGLPQHRERIFMVSILGNESYEFGAKMPLKLKLKDMLSKNVSDKYYLDDETIERISNWNAYEKPLENAIDTTRERERVISTITTHAGKDSSSMKLVKVIPNSIPIKNNTSKGYLEASEGDGIDISSRMHHHRGNVQKNKCQTLTTTGGAERGVIVNGYEVTETDKKP